MARIIFMGTPEYARRILERIVRPDDEWLIVTKPDMPMGRRQLLTPSVVGAWAESRGLSVTKPVKLTACREAWTRFRPDWILTAAYGRILPPWALAIPSRGAFNLHASLLPRWRGANPIAWAVRSRDVVTGVTLMAMDEGMDTGPLVATKETPVHAKDTTESLTERLAELAVDLWIETRARFGEGPWPYAPQSSQGVTMAPKFDPHAGRLDWREPAVVLDAWVRSMTPEPGAYTMLDDVRVKILEAEVDAHSAPGGPGTATCDGEVWRVATGSGSLVVSRIQPAGRRPMTPGQFARGRRGEEQWTLQ